MSDELDLQQCFHFLILDFAFWSEEIRDISRQKLIGDRDIFRDQCAMMDNTKISILPLVFAFPQVENGVNARLLAVGQQSNWSNDAKTNSGGPRESSNSFQVSSLSF